MSKIVYVYKLLAKGWLTVGCLCCVGGIAEERKDEGGEQSEESVEEECKDPW